MTHHPIRLAFPGRGVPPAGSLTGGVHSGFHELGIDRPGGCKEGLIHRRGMRGPDSSDCLKLAGPNLGGRYEECLLTGGGEQGGSLKETDDLPETTRGKCSATFSWCKKCQLIVRES